MRYLPLVLLIGCTPPGKPTPASDTDTFEGLYAQNCAGCHGTDGKLGSGPVLNNTLYLQSIATMDDPFQVITNGRANTLMPAFSAAKGGPLTESQIRTLSTGMRKAWSPSPASQPRPWQNYKPNGDTERGRELYVKTCQVCHGVDGIGGTAGRLNDPLYLSMISNQYLWRIGVQGRDDIGCGRGSLLQLEPDEASNLVAYLATWRKK